MASRKASQESKELAEGLQKRLRSPLQLRDWLLERFPFIVGPSVSDFEPPAGQPGCLVTIRGSEFSLERRENRVEIGGHSCLVVSASHSELRAITPPDVETGPVTVRVGDRTASGPHDFTVVGYPSPGSGDDGPPISFEGAGEGMTGDFDPIGTIRVLVSLVRPDDTVPPDPATARSTVLAAWDSVREYYRQASYGRTDIQVDILDDWAVLDGPLGDFLNDAGDNFRGDQLDRLTAQAAQAAVDEGLDLDDYQLMSTTMFADGTFLRALGGWSKQNFSYDNGLPSGDPGRIAIDITASHPVNLIAIGESAGWGRAAHELGHNVVSSPHFSGDGTATLHEDIYGSDLVDPDAASAARFDLMGSHEAHPLFSGFHMEKLGYYEPDKVIELDWDRNPFSTEFDIAAHGLAEDTTPGRAHLVKVKVASGLTYYIQARQRPGSTAQIFDDSIPLDGASNQGGVIVTAVISDTLNTNQQTRFITLLHTPVAVLGQGESAEDPLRALRITVVEDDVQARPLVSRVRVEWAQTIAADPAGAFDLRIEPWDRSYQSPDIWIDRAPFGSFDSGFDSEGRPLGNGDRPEVEAINHFHSRVHVDGPEGASDVRVTYYAVTPPGVGDNGNWAPLTSVLVPTIDANGYADPLPADWVPALGEHTCLKVHASQQLGEVSGGNNSAQENVFDFVAAGGSPVEPVIARTAIRNPHDERRLVRLSVHGVPRGWRVHFPHSWVWLDGRAERHLDLIFLPLHEFAAYERGKLPRDAGVEIHGHLLRSYDEGQPPLGEPPGSRFYPIGGTLNNVYVRRTSKIELRRDRKAERSKLTVALRGKISPARGGQRVRVELLDPRRRRRLVETETGPRGDFRASFDLRFQPSLEADRARWRRASSDRPGVYRARAAIFDATQAADATSDPVFIKR